MAESIIPLSIYSAGRMNWTSWSTVEEGKQCANNIAKELRLHLQEILCVFGQAEKDWNNEVSSIIIINLSCSFQSLFFLAPPSL